MSSVRNLSFAPSLILLCSGICFSIALVSLTTRPSPAQAAVQPSPSANQSTPVTNSVADATSGVDPSLTKPVFEEVSRLVRTYYPNAKIQTSGNKMHFEFKVGPHAVAGGNRTRMAPNEGGILGDLELVRGATTQKPKIINEYIYLFVVLTPYSSNHECSLVAKLTYPPEVSPDFLEKFKATVRDFDSLLPPLTQGVAPAFTPAQQAPSVVPSSGPSTAPVASQSMPSTVPSTVSVKGVETRTEKQPQKLFFWKATRGSDVVYLCGTIHTAPPNFYPLPKEIEQAFDSSKCLVVEVDVKQHKIDPKKVHQLVESLGKYTAPNKLSNQLTPATKRVFQAYLDWSGETWAMYEPYKPWYVCELVSASIPRRGDISKLKKGLGIDIHFLEKAAALKKPIGEFETVDFQLALDSKLAPDVQDALLQLSLIEMKNTDSMLANIFDAWKRGDVEKMEKTAGHKETPELAPYAKALLDNRNIDMAAKIEPLLKSKGSPLFVAVGAAHMVGDAGLVSLLKKNGFTVEQSVIDGDKR